jgi:hypothetical protein
MGLLNWFSSKSNSTLRSLPAGCFTVDSAGAIVGSTMPQSFPPDQMHQIGQAVIEAFRNLHQARLAAAELQIHYPALRLTAREIRGGALIFMSPRSRAQN